MNHGRAPGVPRYAPPPPDPDAPTVADLVRAVKLADARRQEWSAGPVIVAASVVAKKSTQGRRTGGTRPGSAFLHDGGDRAGGATKGGSA